jgi:glycosyltransferase involved in cell wall biosynthesis
LFLFKTLFGEIRFVRIAIFNWRDTRNPAAGGAEAFVQRLSESLISLGHTVTVFSARFPGCEAEETINGVPHIRFGGKYSIYLLAFSCYRKHVRGRFDIIIESINGVPLFLPKFAKEKVYAFIHQLTRENWYSGLPWPLAFAGYHSEDAMLGAYKRLPVMVPSSSTRDDLVALGFGDVGVIYEAADITPPPQDAGVRKEEIPTLVYLGRLALSKRVDHALEALKTIRTRVPRARLWIIGDGPEKNRLQRLTHNLGLEGCVTFFGRVSPEKKAELLARAHLLIVPAVREGWGLVVLEANSCGTPAIGYDVPGLRDSIKSGTNGILVPDGDKASLAERSASLLSEPRSLEELSRKSLFTSKKFTWKRTAESMVSFIELGTRAR